MHTVGVRLFGAPCDRKAYVISFNGLPPITQTCQGTTYHLYPSGTPDLHYVTTEWTKQNSLKTTVAGQRDVFKAWHRLMSTLHHRVGGEQKRIDGARERIRRVVR